VFTDEGHLGVIEALLDVAIPPLDAPSKARQQFSAFLNRSNSYGQTALMLACKNG
jgi:ankyrin repeat protein